MKYNQISRELFIKNRKKLAERMKPGSIAVFHSNDEMPRNGDASFRFKQNSDVFYLTGVDQEETILVLFPDSPNPLFREMLFIRETSPELARWDGARLTPEEAYEVSGISKVFWYHEFTKTTHPAFLLAEQIYFDLNENDRYTDRFDYAGLRMARELKRKYPAHTLLRSAPIMADLRMCKEPEEIELLKTAIEITRHGFERLLKFVKPGVWEYEIEAELIHEFTRRRSGGFAFDPIIASGASACTLHYIENNRQCKEGDLLLLDFGAEYANYNGDLTRCIPVNGRYSDRQRAVYNAVLHVHKAARELLKPGKLLPDYHAEVCQVMTEQLLQLGLLTSQEIKDNPNAFMKYYMHGTSHHLGIDVHDVMHRWKPIPAGSVLTIEPGIYIPEEGIGVRIENDVILTENGIVDLMQDYPIEADEIEALMAR
ncbi:MAG: aminopeptidase P N-terminal domain-containing protein [Bacteroidetes bacterium]|nr:aminopeptidase P N-terminal domain-containing protein [Bacteroidota bacterium]